MPQTPRPVPRRRRWRTLLALAICVVALLAVVTSRQSGLTVEIQNDSGESWPHGTLQAGEAIRSLPALLPHAKVSEFFDESGKPGGIEFTLTGERITHWNSPHLLTSATRRVLIRIDPLGKVSAKAETDSLAELFRRHAAP